MGLRTRFFVILLPFLFGHVSAAVAAVSAQRTDNGAPVAPEALNAAVTRGGILVRLDAGDSVAVHRLNLRASMPAVAYVAASSEYVVAAVLAGEVASDGLAAGPGQALVQRIGRGGVERYAFDVDRFLASSSLLVDPDLQAALEEARTRQANRIWWGLLEPTGFNAQSPVLPAVEAARRDYLLRPAVIGVRQDARGDRTAMARFTAERFVAAVAARDEATARDLLSPSLFFEGGRGQTEWLTLRAAFARELVNGELGRRLHGAQVEQGDLGNGFLVRAADGGAFRLTEAAFDDMVFVTSLRPE